MSEEECQQSTSLETNGTASACNTDLTIGRSLLHDLLQSFDPSSTSELNDICKQYLMSHAINRDMIHCLLTNEGYTDDWQIEQFQREVWQEYIFWYYVIILIEDTSELSFKLNLPVVLKNLNFFDVSNLSAFIRKIRNKIKFVVKERSADAAQALAVGVVVGVGPLCEKENIPLEWLHNPIPLNRHVEVTKGLVLELRRVRTRHSVNLKKTSLWIKYLCELDYTPDADGMKRQFDRIYKNHQLRLLRPLKYEIPAHEYVNETYQPPQRKVVPQNSQIKADKDCFRKLKIELQKAKKEKLSANVRLIKLRKEYDILKTKHDIISLALTKQSTRKENKKIKRKRSKIIELERHIEQIRKEKKHCHKEEYIKSIKLDEVL